jgi:peptide/nickel transport system ATP-binding protein
MDPDRRTVEAPVAGDPPNPINPPPGCRFHTRCAFAESVCSAADPALTKVDAAGHAAACHLAIAGSGHSKAGARDGMGSDPRGLTPVHVSSGQSA